MVLEPMNPQAAATRWMLEVVRGREVGRRFPLPPGPAVLGNGVGNGQGIDLSGQEGPSPRRMAARQARIELTRSGPVLNDLESPGGTFVNRRRLLPGQAQPLKVGDVIQLGGIQLRVVVEERPSTTRSPAAATASTEADRRGAPRPRATPSEPARPSGSAAPLAFPIPGGPVCRSWDDFVTVSAQRWGALREELISGRLAAYLVASGRSELAPRADAAGSPDDRLDAWLGSLPTSKPSRPELDVHPRSLRFKGTPGARSTQSLRVSNVGFRLLRSRVRVEPAEVAWLIVPPEYTRDFPTVEETVVPVQVALPDPLPGKLTASLVVEGNGGTARVSVAVEPPGPSQAASEPIAGPTEPGEWSPEAIGRRIAGWLARRSARSRLIGGTVAAVLIRLGIGAACGLSAAATLPGPAAVLAMAGGVLGGVGGWRRGGPGEAPFGAFAGAFGGAMAAAVLVAACQAIEPMLGAMGPATLFAAVVLWGFLGLAAGAGSLALVPDRRSSQEGTRS